MLALYDRAAVALDRLIGVTFAPAERVLLAAVNRPFR